MSQLRRSFITLMLGILLVTPATAERNDQCDQPTTHSYLVVDGVRLNLEVASTEEQREEGLMFRTDLARDQGMLFTFARPTQVGFWMRDTPVPLSVAWLAADRTIIDVRQMQPMTETVHVSPRPFQYAVEANPQWFNAHHVRPGEQVHLCLTGGASGR